jgi:hypothetical protein
MVWSLSEEQLTPAVPQRAIAFAVAKRQRPDKGGLYTFLRNEPISFSSTFHCITLIYRDLCRLQWRLQMGSFSENEPIFRGVYGDDLCVLIPKTTASGAARPTIRRGMAGQSAGTLGRLMAGQTQCVFYNGRGVGARVPAKGILMKLVVIAITLASWTVLAPSRGPRVDPVHNVQTRPERATIWYSVPSTVPRASSVLGPWVA